MKTISRLPGRRRDRTRTTLHLVASHTAATLFHFSFQCAVTFGLQFFLCFKCFYEQL